ncbi:putative quinol monooxygenase [Lysinibacter cavernae]|uniref:Quinol monooxygenase YgiN n=1 Tax=Lysinibacter cavernae TaxID=1640652 RepID=A0A7X5TSW3_9MICO|nr:antibiotic biosynthesis monooxygenase [Lysinibacter cavernae]NIH53961.1 quinol monooxygenase YgiN [Lysinibacter cavernae]
MSSPYFQVIAHYTVAAGNTPAVLPLLAQLAAASRTEPANLLYNFFQDAEDPNHIVILERYTDEAGFAAHRESAHFQEIGVGKIIPLLEDRYIESYVGASND